MLLLGLLVLILWVIMTTVRRNFDHLLRNLGPLRVGVALAVRWDGRGWLRPVVAARRGRDLLLGPGGEPHIVLRVVRTVWGNGVLPGRRGS